MGFAISADEVRQVFPEVAEIRDDALRSGVTEIWIDTCRDMPWDTLQEVPKNVKGEMYRPLVEHVRAVTQMALRLAETAKEFQGLDYDRDMLVAACLLHDASKPLECEPDPEAEPSRTVARPARKSLIGRNIQHAVYAAHKVLEKKLPVELAHLVITHTHGSNMRGTTWEAALLFYADFADTDAGLARISGTMYSQRWKL